MSKAEKLTFEQLFLNHQHRDICTQAAGVLLLGIESSASKVAERLGASVQGPYNRVRVWNESGMCGRLTDR
ncbi:hypothetical protein [Burkholderia cenocepacia]|uniref:hypothetical protein n=1 Tax=Burkholderia cenocepacia TaxID=95486 RepID=UPI00158F346A|nr:hypothetical protein [Burkholderia cenocepacia]